MKTWIITIGLILCGILILRANSTVNPAWKEYSRNSNDKHNRLWHQNDLIPSYIDWRSAIQHQIDRASLKMTDQIFSVPEVSQFKKSLADSRYPSRANPFKSEYALIPNKESRVRRKNENSKEQ